MKASNDVGSASLKDVGSNVVQPASLLELEVHVDVHLVHKLLLGHHPGPPRRLSRQGDCVYGGRNGGVAGGLAYFSGPHPSCDTRSRKSLASCSKWICRTDGGAP